jgi:hypothetical protein
MWWPHCHATWKGSVAVAGERHSTWKEMRAILIDLFPLWHRDGGGAHGSMLFTATNKK